MSENYVLDQPSGLTCPECGGALLKVESQPIPKYVCHIGHELTGAAMLEAQTERIEELLSGALALLNEHRELCRQLLQDGITDDHERVRAIIADTTDTANAVRDLLNHKRKGAAAAGEDAAPRR